MQDHPGAPGTARQESTRIIVSTYNGGTATQPRAPGHERPHAALCAARHGRLSAASTAPGADIPRDHLQRGAPGQYCQSAALRAPGHGRPLAITAEAPCHGRLSAAPRAPADDAAPAIAATVPNHHRPSAAPIATVSSPAGPHRLRQVILPRTPATPNTLIYSHSHPNAANNRAAYSQVSTCRHFRLPPRHSRESGNPRPPVATGGPQGGYAPAPSPGACSGGGLGRGQLPTHPITHQVHPAIQVPPHPRSCSTAATGGLRQPPPAPRRETASPLPWSLLRGRVREGASNRRARPQYPLVGRLRPAARPVQSPRHESLPCAAP